MTSQEISESRNFIQYPRNLRRNRADASNLQFYYDELNRKSAALFVNTPNNYRVALWEAQTKEAKTGEIEEQTLSLLWISSLDDLKNNLETCLARSSTTIIIIQRKNSWSRMKLSAEMFKLVCSSLEVYPRFLDLAFDFAQRSSPADDTSVRYYENICVEADSRTIPSSFVKSMSLVIEDDFITDNSPELCYNLRFVEPHGRPISDRWSYRHSAVCQKGFLLKRQTAWIVIHQPLQFSKSLEDAKIHASLHPMSLHLRYIRSTTHYWKEYLEDRGAQLESFNSKISLPKPLVEFDVDFVRSQNLQSIQGKLHQAVVMLAGTLRVVGKLSDLACTITKWTKVPCSDQVVFQMELKQISGDMESFISVTKHLIQQCEQLRLTNNHILTLTNQEMMARSGMMVAQLAQTNLDDNRASIEMVSETRQDSRTMRIATIVAIVFLPANLVMSFFSTIFVNFKTAETQSISDVKGGINVNSHVWIAILLSIASAVVTLAAITLWDKQHKTSNHTGRYSRADIDIA